MEGKRHRILVAGTNRWALRIGQELAKSAGVEVLGYVDKEWAGSTMFRATGNPLVADLKNLRPYLRQNAVDNLVIALPASVVVGQPDLLAACGDFGVSVSITSHLLRDLGFAQLPWAPHSSEIVLRLPSTRLSPWRRRVKRVIDLIGSTTLLVVAAPLLVSVAIAIRVTSRGTVLFSQERVGYNGRHFRMLKFRTMVPNAEALLADLEDLNETGGATFKLRQDPRVTPLGRILRATSIDELPQLWNVLRGDMSLVGPRPLPLSDIARFRDDRHFRRFSMPPGITGLWQVSGRSSVGFEDWMALDLDYIDDWSLALDLKILLRTIPTVLGTRESAW